MAWRTGRLWTDMWAPILLGGDARYLNGDPLIVVLEWIAFFVGLFEAYVLVQFFRNGKRFTSTQLSFIMAGMIVEVTLPAVYSGVEIANNLESTTSPRWRCGSSSFFSTSCVAPCRSSPSSGVFVDWPARISR